MEYRFANRNDCSLILYFVKELAKYEKLENEVVADVSLFEKYLFDEKKANVIFALDNDKEVGFALYFDSFSTFLGKPGIYLEDLFVLSDYREKGYGTFLLKTLFDIAKEKGYERIEWICLDWNKKSVEFYEKLGAIKLDDWTKFRFVNGNVND